MRLDHGVGIVVAQESFVSGKSRNAILNEGGRLYCELADLKRQLACMPPTTAFLALEGFIRKHLPTVNVSLYSVGGSAELTIRSRQ